MYSLQKISVSIFLLVLPYSVNGGDPYYVSSGAGEAGMGFVCVMKPAFWSSFHNQALLSSTRSLSFGFNYQSRFSIKELGTRSAGLIIPAGGAVIGAVYSQFGYHDFKRESGGLACGLKLSEKISAGVQADYYSERTYGEYNDHRFITCEAGITISPGKTTIAGIHVFNPLHVFGIKNNLPSSLCAGIGTFLNGLLFAGVEAEISTWEKLNVKTGFEYEAAKRFKLRGGFSTGNSSFSFGLGYRIETVMLDISFATHERLGVTPSFSLVFNSITDILTLKDGK